VQIALFCIHAATNIEELQSVQIGGYFMGPGVNADHGAYSRLMGQWRAGGVKRTVIVCGTRITRGPGEGPLAQLARVCARYQWSQCTTSSKGRRLGRASGRSGRSAG